MDSDILSLKRRLNENAVEVCSMLLPQGRVEGPEFVFDPGQGKIKVALRGQKIGLWSHFGGSEDGGDLIALWCYAKQCSLPQALDDIRAWFGIERPRFDHEPRRQWTKPRRPSCVKPQERVRDYLVEERNIHDHILDRYKIGEQGNLIVFPFMRDGELVMAKTREAVAGAAPKPTESGCEKILFGWQAVPDNARQILITEGEIDAMSMAAYQDEIPALSVPFGGGSGNKQDWIESEFDRLQRFEVIYLCLDNDPVGEAGTVEIIKRLGAHRCRIVKLPRKDANECLVEGISAEVIKACIAEAKTLDPEGLHRPMDYLDEVMSLFWPKEGEREGYTLPFSDVGNKLCFRPGEVTIWSGEQGSGKSQILSYAKVNWIAQGSRICEGSFEMAAKRTLKRTVKQASNTDRPTVQMIERTLAWMNDGLLLFDLLGKAELTKLLEVFDYARAKYGCDQFIIDSFMRLGIASDDYKAQEQAMFRIVTWAITNGVHVHLVAHSRKGERGSTGVPEGNDIKGAQEIAANAFNILTVWRNHQREEAEQNGAPDDPRDKERYDKLMNQAGVILNCCKQRNGDWDGKTRLWFNRETYQYRGPSDSRFGIDFTALSANGSNEGRGAA